MSKDDSAHTTPNNETSKLNRRKTLLALAGLAATAGVSLASDEALSSAEVASSEVWNWEQLHYKDILHRLHSPASAANAGERVARLINEKTRTDLADLSRNVTAEADDPVIAALFDTHESLKTRLALVDCAIARLAHAGADVSQI